MNHQTIGKKAYVAPQSDIVMISSESAVLAVSILTVLAIEPVTYDNQEEELDFDF